MEPASTTCGAPRGSPRHSRPRRLLRCDRDRMAQLADELESLDPTAQATFTPLAQAAMKAAVRHLLNTGGGKVVGIDGPPPPKRVVIKEWDSLDQAEAYYKSKAWNDLAPQRDKAIKTIRRYAVESAN